MNKRGASHGYRLASVALAIGMHAAAAAAFMLTPIPGPARPPEGVEIELLAEVTSVVAAYVPPSIAAEAEAIQQSAEALAGEAVAKEGEPVEEFAVLHRQTAEITSEEVRESTKDEDQPQTDRPPEIGSFPEARRADEAETKPNPEAAAHADFAADATPEARSADIDTEAAVEGLLEAAPVNEPVELKTPLVETPRAPALSRNADPRRKVIEDKPRGKPAKVMTEKSPARTLQKRPKTEKRRGAVAGSALTHEGKRKGASRSQISGGRQSASQYRSIVQARLSARRGAISSSVGAGVKGRVIIAFSIGVSGRVTSASVSRSSGNARLDAVARSVVASTAFPPPPGGSFRSGIPIAVE